MTRSSMPELRAILTARLPVARIKERWAAYQAGLDAAGHDAATKARLLAQSALIAHRS
jgi:hypothetical protein